MPIIRPDQRALSPIQEFPAWGLAQFTKGMKNITELHFHDSDEWVFMVSGQCLMRSEGVLHTLNAGDVLVTRMGDEHELLEILEDTVYFWTCTELRGQKRPGHLHRDQND